MRQSIDCIFKYFSNILLKSSKKDYVEDYVIENDCILLDITRYEVVNYLFLFVPLLKCK